MNWKVFGKKPSWFNSWYYSIICLEGLVKTTKNLRQDGRSPGRDLNRDLQNTNHSTTTFCLYPQYICTCNKWVSDQVTMLHRDHIWKNGHSKLEFTFCSCLRKVCYPYWQRKDWIEDTYWPVVEGRKEREWGFRITVIIEMTAYSWSMREALNIFLSLLLSESPRNYWLSYIQQDVYTCLTDCQFVAGSDVVVMLA
jgi:hypothetical protein